MGQILSVRDFLSMVLRRIVLILAVLIAGTVFSVFWTLGQPRIYEATAVAQIESPTITDAAAATPGEPNIEHRLRLLEQQLMARDNLIAMIDRHALYSDTDLSANLKVAALREAVRIVQITDTSAGFGAARVPTGMVITVTHSDQVTSAVLANEFLEQLVDLNRKRRSVAALENLEFFKSEAARVEAEMTALEGQIAGFKEQNSSYLPTGIAAQRSEMSTLRATLLQLEQQLIELEASRTRQRSEVIERQTNLLREQQSLINQRIGEIEAAIGASPEVDRQFGILNRQLEQLKSQYDVITRRATEAEMGQLLESQQHYERIEVLETALVPENPISGSRKKKVLLGGFLSGILGLALAFALEAMNPVIRTRSQLERALNVKAVVAIPYLATPAQRRRKWLIWITILAALLAGLSAGWSTLRDAIASLGQALSRRAGRA